MKCEIIGGEKVLIMEEYPMSSVAEAYRILRTNLQYSSFNGQYKVIVITSANPQEGKSTTAVNIALALAQAEKKVILIDCDLRKPTLNKRFNMSNSTGLSELVISRASKATIGEVYNENLTVLTSGRIPPNPSEILGSKYMSSLIYALRSVYDYIILDAPPVQVVTDAQVLSAKADGTILVVKAEVTKKSSVHNAINMLRKVNANIIGIVLNEVEKKESHYYQDIEEE
ncbi:CpsD/CapB family tyrosine-protein kinase [Clostridium culturomicium]|uniref:CpsD/CapB family tyrosine-protein kinase n=1 Tax=Clostridium culturomicium TaxID=1499683 RepID=UPI00385723A8